MFTNILVPLDGSELAEQAVPKAQTLAQSFNATVHLLHVVSRSPEMEALRFSGDINFQEVETSSGVLTRVGLGSAHVGE